MIEPLFALVGFCAALGLFVLAEGLRMAQLPPFSTSVFAFMRSYLDIRDSGAIILSHIYLLLGCAVPLFLHYAVFVVLTNDHHLDVQLWDYLPAVSGVMVLGVGDAAASVVGSYWGTLFWPDSKKTFQGTAGAFVSLLVTCALAHAGAQFLPVVPGAATATATATAARLAPFASPAIWLATFLTCLLEALTTQIDNLFLPLFYYSAIVSFRAIL
jgi:dolichol kinase